MKTAVLLMAHGSPDRLDQMGDYLRRVMKHREPTSAFIAEMTERYRLIGGRSPLLDVTRRQAAALEIRLGMRVYVAMRHWQPFIADVAAQARSEGFDRLVGLPMAPQYARVSVGAYEMELQGAGVPHVTVKQWHLEPCLLDYWRMVTRDKAFVLFTAHSIPVEGAEPYPTQLAEMVNAIATGPHAFAYQSKSPSPIPWLAPEVLDVLRTVKGRVSVAPIGFVCDHVEVLYDLDILHRKQAEELGIQWDRLPMPNDHPLLIEALASAVRKHL